MTPEEQHDAQELRYAQEREQSQSQVAETNTVQMEAHHAQRNSPERGRYQQLGNDKCEGRNQDEEGRVASLNSTERALFNLRNESNQRTYKNTQNKSTTGIDPEFAAYISDFCQSCQKGFK